MGIITKVFAIFNREFASNMQTIQKQQQQIATLEKDLASCKRGLNRMILVTHRANMLLIEWSDTAKANHALAFKNAASELRSALNSNKDHQNGL